MIPKFLEHGGCRFWGVAARAGRGQMASASGDNGNLRGQNAIDRPWKLVESSMPVGIELAGPLGNSILGANARRFRRRSADAEVLKSAARAAAGAERGAFAGAGAWAASC